MYSIIAHTCCLVQQLTLPHCTCSICTPCTYVCTYCMYHSVLWLHCHRNMYHSLRRLKPAETKEPKHPVGGRMGISPHFSSAPPTSSQTLPARGSVRDVNTYEDFQKKVMPEILYASLPNQVTPSSAGTRVFGPVRKARSETDLRESELEKELKVLFVHVGLCCPLMIRICTMQVALREERGGLYALRIIIRSNTVCYNTICICIQYNTYLYHAGSIERREGRALCITYHHSFQHCVLQHSSTPFKGPPIGICERWSLKRGGL